MGWIIFLAIAVPLIAVLGWLALDESFVRIEPGQLGLLLIKGKATDQALEPGPHWVPALRRRMVQPYPSCEMSYRAGGDDASTSELERSGPPLRAVLADRFVAVVPYTIRFRLDVNGLRTVHERFGPEGIWAAVRDLSDAAIRRTLAGTEVEDLFGERRESIGQLLSEAVGERLASAGIVLTMFELGAVDLGRTGEVIEATARARFELAREEAEADLRVARARIDSALAPFAGGGGELAMRYREVDSWRELARGANVIVPVPPRKPAADVRTESSEATADEEQA